MKRRVSSGEPILFKADKTKFIWVKRLLDEGNALVVDSLVHGNRLKWAGKCECRTGVTASGVESACRPQSHFPETAIAGSSALVNRRFSSGNVFCLKAAHSPVRALISSLDSS